MDILRIWKNTSSAIYFQIIQSSEAFCEDPPFQVCDANDDDDDNDGSLDDDDDNEDNEGGSDDEGQGLRWC